ncbi:RhoGAP-domain-containing protein [Lepidopterella palustris CBS 459.81]|uniref:RhoGAP-domain-containing protein n=1 Tax=Lepidopterella palustris CBS 459.81 TaxID=1314670 RepID=A0A8E2JCJ9_9PEZI|nr:RhoGAP-domain-containing protein [Lepidopterella palustris CBS 459.81]
MDAIDRNAQKAVDEVIYSDIGVNVLLERLKQSIASARDFAAFLKKRGAIEETHANDLKKACRATQEAVREQKARHGSYASHVEEALRINERVADNGSQFGLSLHQMHTDLIELSNNMDRGRKQMKQTGLAAEKKAQDAEALMDKAKAKYDSLAEEYDRVKTGDSSAGRKFGLKGPKSAAQHEEDLNRKVQAADADYFAKVQAAQAQRQELVTLLRPQTVNAILLLIREMDAGLTVQLAKFASFNEKLIADSGKLISPIPGANPGEPLRPSLKATIAKIDNERDFQQFIIGHTANIPARPADIKYIKHPTLVQAQPQPTPSAAPRQSLNMQTSQPPPSFAVQPPQSVAHPPQHYDQPTYVPDTRLQSQNSGYQQREPARTSPYSGQPQQPPYAPPNQPQQPPYAPPNQSQYQSPPYSISPAGQQRAPQVSGAALSNLPPIKPVFGVSLDELFRRDGTPVPLVVYQCIQAVDLFGLKVEGIYRISGTLPHIQAMKAQFNNDATKVDFRNPEAFHQDVNSVAGLLKMFFRELPDPLLTAEHYEEFLNAARIEDDTTRRDSMHAIINGLPDPNYATLRALILHLHRVVQHSMDNRMTSSNISICFAPTIMGPHHGPMQDAGNQARVVQTILDNAFQIFDDE